jgi:uncharacterized DUF497 family protein
MKFEWDENKNLENQKRHGVSFESAQGAFCDSKRLILLDPAHSNIEERSFCIGITEGGIMTVRFTIRDEVIRIIGAGYWRKGKKLYEQENRKK